MRDTIDGLVFKEMIINAALSIDDHKQVINDLNVFPVPDGDTGTNMSLSMNAAMNLLMNSTPTGIGHAAELTAGALLRGGRGNSGVILSQLFKGFARALKDKNTATTKDYANALNEGVTTAYKVVAHPSEGTILTVARLVAAAACEAAESEQDMEALFEIAIKTGRRALADTINQNPVLKKAGVIDAGGKGYMIILEAMLASLRGEVYASSSDGAKTEVREKATFSDFSTEDITFGYCTEFIVNRENNKDPQKMWEFLSVLGDSTVVVDDDEIIKVHVHTDRPGDVITEALTYGSLLTVKIENMREQHTETIAREQTEPEAEIAAPEKSAGVVAVCAGDGLEAVFKDLGVDKLVSGGQTMNPSTEDILKAINKTPSETVFVLPNNGNIKMAAEQCIGMTPKNVIVIPSKTVPQGISAMLAFDPDGDIGENTDNMTEAIKNVHTISLTYAARDSLYDDTEIKEGDYLALLENKLLSSDSELSKVREAIVQTLKDFSPEFITIFYGADTTGDAAEEFTSVISESLPEAEITTVRGGQPVYYYLISAE